MKNSRLETADLRIEGLERVATADLALSLDWRTERSWPWKGRVHINILESSTISRLFLHLALEGGPLRFANLCDSNSGPSALGPPGLFDQPCCRPLSWWPLLPH